MRLMFAALTLALAAGCGSVALTPAGSSPTASPSPTATSAASPSPTATSAASPSPSRSPVASSRPSPTRPDEATASPPPAPSGTPIESPDPAFHLLPDSLLLPDDASISLSPRSSRGVELGVAYVFSLGHCGLLSPFDFDGSLWEQVAGRDAIGGPIDSQREQTELINATSGQVLLPEPDSADFLTPGGSVIRLERIDGSRDYPACM